MVAVGTRPNGAENLVCTESATEQDHSLSGQVRPDGSQLAASRGLIRPDRSLSRAGIQAARGVLSQSPKAACSPPAVDQSVRHSHDGRESAPIASVFATRRRKHRREESIVLQLWFRDVFHESTVTSTVVVVPASLSDR